MRLIDHGEAVVITEAADGSGNRAATTVLRPNDY
jgi:hypothetical protein